MDKAVFTFTYQGIDDKYENGKKLEYTFNSGDAMNSLTSDQVIEHFEYFLRCCGYITKVYGETPDERR